MGAEVWEKTEGGRCGSPEGGKAETPEGGSRLESPEGSVVGARSGHELAHARHAPPGMRKLTLRPFFPASADEQCTPGFAPFF